MERETSYSESDIMDVVSTGSNKDMATAVFKPVFDLLDALEEGSDGVIRVDLLLKVLDDNGIRQDDPRVKPMIKDLQDIDVMDFDIFCKVMANNTAHSLIRKTLKGNLAVDDWVNLTKDLREIFDEIERIDYQTKGWKNADYIAELAEQDPLHFAVSIASIDGQFSGIGNSSQMVSIQSCIKPILFLIACELNGFEKMMKHVSCEPSGFAFNSLVLKKTEIPGKSIPHNPMINAGAMMSAAMILPHGTLQERFKMIREYVERCVGGSISFSNEIFLSETGCADANRSLAFFMKNFNAFDETMVNNNNHVEGFLTIYFMACSLLVNTDQMARIAATFANGGLNPQTGDRIFSAENVKRVLSMMQSCGMYDTSGLWSFKVGIPAKSGVGGHVYAVVPGLFGICVTSPMLNQYGNSGRGTYFLETFEERYAMHQFDCLPGLLKNQKGFKKSGKNSKMKIGDIIDAAQVGDLAELTRYVALGADPFKSDYDQRTALHLACCSNNVKVVNFLLKLASQNTSLSSKALLKKVVIEDRWGRTCLDDAKLNEATECEKIVSEWIASLPKEEEEEVVAENFDSADFFDKEKTQGGNPDTDTGNPDKE